MNELTVETIVALYEAAKVCVELNNGRISRMMIEGGDDNE